MTTDPNGNRHEIAVDDDLAFLVPYITKARKLGVPVWRLRAIKGYSVPDGKIEHQSGATIKDGNSKLTITLLKWHQQWKRSKNGKFEVSHWHAADSAHYFEATLESFAHELTHLTHWEHDAHRYIAEKKIQLSFAYLARKRGYNGYK